MSQPPRTLKYKGVEYEVQDRLRIGGQTYHLIGQLGRNGRIRHRALQQFGTNQYQERMIHVLPQTGANKRRIQNLNRAAGTNLPLPRVISFSEFKNQLLVVMEWIPGQSLKSYLDEIRRGSRPRMSPFEAVRLNCGFVRQVSTLAAKLGVFHGDIAPDNLVLSPNNHRLVLIDFGSSFRFSEIGNRDLGDGFKIAYQAPEQFQGRPADFLSEQFGCAMVFYEMLTGKIAYDGIGGAIEKESRSDDKIELVLPSRLEGANSTKFPQDVWKLVDEFIATGLALSPESRFATNNEWISAAQNLLEKANYTTAANPPKTLLTKAFDIFNKLTGR
jgi:serine/threonine protein kinase